DYTSGQGLVKSGRARNSFYDVFPLPFRQTPPGQQHALRGCAPVANQPTVLSWIIFDAFPYPGIKDKV
ncbi:MAG: hypothetical protein VB041_10195, partial [Candidatus Limiplasma sp.]|nr:hypothetical protein [Candidatus Limiplasma sp.]